MNNHWLSHVKKKKMLKAIDDIGMEVWSSDGTFGEFLRSLNKEQKSFLLSMHLSDFSCEVDEDAFRMELLKVV